MAFEATNEQLLLDSLASTMATQVPLAIDAINSILVAGGKPSLADPATYTAVPSGTTYEVREDLENVPLERGPHVAIFVEGDCDNDDWMSQHVDIIIPLAIVLTSHQADTPTTTDFQSRYYCRALETGLRKSYKTAGAWHCGDVMTSIEKTGNDRNRRHSIVRATLRLRTTRGST